MKNLIVLACGLMLFPGVAFATDVYKWKDADGRIRYSDAPPQGKIPYDKVIGKKPVAPAPAAGAEDAEGAAPAAKPAATPVADKELEAKKRKAEAENIKKKEQAKQDELKLREENCKTAKSNMQNYKQGGRMYKINEKGEREYLDDKAISDGLDKANKEVEQWCSGL